MKQGLERLFWAIGGLLLLPFVLQQGIILSQQSSVERPVPQLRSMPPVRPAIATTVQPVGAAAEAPQPHARVTVDRRPAPDTELWSSSRSAAWGEMIGLMERPVGQLLIPSLNVQVPVFPDTDEVSLTLGAGLIPGTGTLETEGNIGMASHRDGYFRHLKDVEIGDLLLVKTATRLRQFRVVETLVVDPADTWVLDPGARPAITLVTCYPFRHLGSAPQRYIVSAQEVQTELTGIGLGKTVIGGHHETLKF